jgi:hypothetical protein
VLIVRLLFCDVRNANAVGEGEILVRISKRKEEQMVREEEVQGQIANRQANS